MMQLLALLLAACRAAPEEAPNPVPPAAAATTVAADCARPGETPMNLPPLEEDVLFQYLSGDREGQRSGFRVHQDGRLERMRKDGPWKEDKPLDAGRLDALKKQLDAAGLGKRDRVYRPEVLPDDATSWSMQLRGAGEPIALQGEGCRPAFVDELFEGIAPLLQPHQP